MRKFIVFAGMILFLGVSLCFAQEESITITTYYPSPYGSYNELRAKKMGIGNTYYQGTVPIPTSGLIVEGSVGIGTSSPMKDTRLTIGRGEKTGIWVSAETTGINVTASPTSPGIAVGISASGIATGEGYEGTGVHGSGDGVGVSGSSSSGKGVKGKGYTGVWGESEKWAGIYGEGPEFGVFAILSSKGTFSERAAVYADGYNAGKGNGRGLFVTGSGGKGEAAIFQGGDVKIRDGWSLILEQGTYTKRGDITADTIYCKKIEGVSSDVAEWLDKEESYLPKKGDLAQLNFQTGLIEKYNGEGEYIGVVSSLEDAFIVGAAEDTKNKALVALVGQITADESQVLKEGRKIYTYDRKYKIGVLLANGKVLLRGL